LLGTKFWISLGLCLSSLLLAYLVAIPLGIYSATGNRPALNGILRVISYFGLAIPNFEFFDTQRQTVLSSRRAGISGLGGQLSTDGNPRTKSAKI